MEHTGRLPNRKEIAEWEEDKYLSFLAFCQHFIESKLGGTAWRVTPDKRTAVEKLAATDPHYKEFLERIELSGADTDDKKFYYRLMTMVRLVLGYLRLNPDRITPAMRQVLEGSKRFNWCLEAHDQPPTIVPVLLPARPLTPEGQLADAWEQMVNILHMLVESIKAKDIARMSVKERLLVIPRLQHTLGLNRKVGRSRSSVFANIDVKNANRQELERAMLSYAEQWK